MRNKIIAFTLASLALFPLTALGAPAITNIRTLTTGPTIAVIAWDTNTASTTEIEYGIASVYESTVPINYTPQTGHTVTLENLIPSTTYKFIVKSTDSNGERTVSTENTFSTLAGTTTTTTTAPTLEAPKPPVISNLQVYTTDTTATISWNTNVPSDSYVEYGPTSTYGSNSRHDYSQVLEHSLTIDKLTPETEYHYIIKITGINGLPAVSPDKTFTTSKKIPQTSVILNPSPQVNITQPLPVPPEEKIVLPYGVKEGQVLKFKKNPAIYLVKPSGLYPFTSMADYRAYIKKSKQKLKTLNGDGSSYTKRTDPASI